MIVAYYHAPLGLQKMCPPEVRRCSTVAELRHHLLICNRLLRVGEAAFMVEVHLDDDLNDFHDVVAAAMWQGGRIQL